MKSQINAEQYELLLQRKKYLLKEEKLAVILLVILIVFSLFIWVFIFTLFLYFLLIPLILIVSCRWSSIKKELVEINFKLASAPKKFRKEKEKELKENVQMCFCLKCGTRLEKGICQNCGINHNYLSKN